MNRADNVLLWIRLVLSLVQLVAALALIGLLLEPQLADGIDRLETAGQSHSRRDDHGHPGQWHPLQG